MTRPMLCRLAVGAHDRPGWVWERKYDGVRMLAFIGDGPIRLQARSGADKTAQFPDMVQALAMTANYGAAPMILDGEVVSADGLSFQEFSQRRMNRTEDIDLLARELPASFVVFDLLRAWGKDLMGMPLKARLRQLEQAKPSWCERPVSGPNGIEMFERAKAEGWEGIVGKRLDEPYLFGKRAWLKVKVWREGVFTLCDPVPGLGRREGLAGSFSLMDSHGNYVGHVGTGFDEAELRWLTAQVRAGDEPVYARVKYCELTNDEKLRFPVYLEQVADGPPQEPR